MEFKELKEIGLSESETNIYTTLLKYGELTVAEISQNSGLHRTNIYDSLEKLKEKGLISSLTKERKQYFRAANPESLIGYISEKEELIKKIIPKLKEVQSKITEKVTVEIFKGEQGMKTVLKDILLKKQKVFGYSISGQLRKFLPEFSDYYFREQNKNKIIHKFIYTEGIKSPGKYYQVKYLPKEYITSTGNLCYGDTILNLIWEPEMTAIRIKSKQLADDFKKHFELLWKTAKDK